MKRKQYAVVALSALLIFSLGGSVAVLLVSGGNIVQSQQHTSQPTVSEVPEDVESAKPLAYSFYRRITEYYPDSQVSITQKGYIVFQFTPKSETGDGVQREMANIAVEYSRTVNETTYSARTLSILTANLEAIVTEPAVEKHASGNLTTRAYKKTIEVRTRGNQTS